MEATTCLWLCFLLVNAAANAQVLYLCVPSLLLSVDLATVCAGHSGRNVDSIPVFLRAAEYACCNPTLSLLPSLLGPQ